MMDLQTGVICVGLIVVAAAFIGLISMFSMKEKSYEEAIAEQRKLPDDLLLGKKEKGKEKKHKNKTGKKVKEKKDEKEEKEEKIESAASVQFEETAVVLPVEPVQEAGKAAGKKKNKIEKVKPILVNKDESPLIDEELVAPETPVPELNNFERVHPKDSLELRARTVSYTNPPTIQKESTSLQHTAQSEPIVNKSPKETPTRSKKSVKEPAKKKEEVVKDEKRETSACMAAVPLVREAPKEPKEVPKESTPSKETKDVVAVSQTLNKESKKTKKKNDILAQIGGDRDGVNVSLLMPLVQKAELSRSEIQILIDQLLNKQLDNPLEHSEWTEGRTDPVIKLKKQLAEKDKALVEEHEASSTFQNKLKELRAELNAERSRLTTIVKQLEDSLNAKVTEAQTLHTRMQHILESHAAEKQGFARQIEQLQAKVNDDAAIIHKMQEDQGQTQGHMQQELIAQRKQLEVQFGQMRDNENALKSQLAQKHVEVQDLQTVNMNMTQELQATCESSTAEIEMLRQQLGIMQEQYMHSEAQLQHFKEAGERMQDMARQLEESHRAHADFDHRLKNAHRHEQELQKQIHGLQTELKISKTEANETSSLKNELSKVQSELIKLKSDLSMSQNEAKSEAAEITSLRTAINEKNEQINYYQNEATKLDNMLRDEKDETTNVRTDLAKVQEDARNQRIENEEIVEQLTKANAKITKLEVELSTVAEGDKSEFEAMRNGGGKSSDIQLQITRLQEENDRLSAQLGKFAELQKELNQLREENESLASQLAATTERPAVEGRENGVEEKTQKNNVELLEHANLLKQKESQLDALKVELTNKEDELNRLRSQIENLQSEVNKRDSIAKRLQDDLEAQRSKNNDLRTKNWKVMEALSAAESRAKNNIGTPIDNETEKMKIDEQEITKSLLQRIFPDVRVSEKSYERWLGAFEEQVNVVLTDLRKRGDSVELNELEKQNKSLQGMVSHYKQIIVDTEGMLNKLQNQIEIEQSRWESLLIQKEKEIAYARIELEGLQNKSPVNDDLQRKIAELESRLAEEKILRDESKAEIIALRAATQEEKERLDQELINESKNNEAFKKETELLRSTVAERTESLERQQNLVSTLESEILRLKTELQGASNITEQSTTNGPATSDAPKSEPTRPEECLLAALERTLAVNADSEKSSVNETVNSVQSQRETDDGSLASEINSKSCHTTENDTQPSWNPLNGQQQKKHKKKRKGGSGKK